MKLSGSYTFSAPREEVWELLMDPQTLRRIIPGCERLEQTGEDSYAADIKLGLAGVKGDYSGTVRITEQHPPEHYRLQGDGRGKPGFAKGDGRVELSAEPNGTTTMRYTADAQVGGPVASIGQRLIEGAAKSIVNQSLKALSAELEARQAGREGQNAGSNGASGVPQAPPNEGSSTAASTAAQPAVAEAPTPMPAPAAPPAPPAPGGLTTADVVRGMVEDLWAEQPAVRLGLALVVGFVLGLLAGRRGGKGS